MKISIIGPATQIPPIGWGAVESLIWDYKIFLEKMGHEIQIVNIGDPAKIIENINSFNPDFVHINYDDWVGLYPYINYPCSCTTHFAYLERPELMGGYVNIFNLFKDIKPNVFCLSEEIKKVYRTKADIPSHKLFVTPNGVNTDIFEFTLNPEYPDRSIYLAKIDYRKRQYKFQDIDSIWYAGNIADSRFDTSKNYLGEWSKEVLHKNLTQYGNLILLSDGEAHPLVCMEAFAAGLGVVISEYATANLDQSKEFITIIPEDKIGDIKYIEEQIIKNRNYSVKHREEILEYSKQFSWEHILSSYFIPMTKKVIANHNNSKKKLAINFIGTGSYLKFFPKYYETIMEYFVPECEKDFFVFTDGELGDDIPDNIKIIPISEKFEAEKSDYLSNNWYNLMYNSVGGLRRFGEIKKIESQLKEYDWYIYFDADMYCCSEVISYEDFFNDDKPFFGVQHPTYSSNWKKFNGYLPFERNSKSLSCVNPDEEMDDVYLQGCIWGGKIPEIFSLIDELDLRIKKDLQNDVMAKAHDESHLNKYRIENYDKFHILNSAFAKPGDYSDDEFNFSARMIHSPSDKRQILIS
jgi:glycosyltransferase involved in cell wall biosynthesis